MNIDHSIIIKVRQAKEDMRAADELIRAYMPFIRNQTAKFLKRPVTDEHEDELSIAMIAFYEAVMSYSVMRGSFLHYAALSIKSRLIDHVRKEARHLGVASLNAPIDDDEGTSLIDTLAEDEDPVETSLVRAATREEIAEFSANLEDFGVTFTDVAEHCPDQKRTLAACKRALDFAVQEPKIMEDFLRTKRVPITRIAQGAQVDPKTLERHRKYIVALLLAYTNGYEIIRGHLKHVLN